MLRVNIAKKSFYKVAKELDAFPKIPEECQETSASGGGLSIVMFLIITVLLFFEFQYYTATELEFDYEVDTDIARKMKINIDMTVAMKCIHVGADVLDQTGQDVFSSGELMEEPVFFDLSPNQQAFLDFTQGVNEYLRQEYHALQDLLWRSDKMAFSRGMPPRDDFKMGTPDACHIHGSLDIRKVSGNFHVTAGKSVPVIPKGHAHLSFAMDSSDYNFSHRIDHFSFGDPVSGIIYPLDGTLAVTNNGYHIFQYFVKIVPTEVRTRANNVDTFQFAVTEQDRTINHAEGSHGVPGVFVKYDLTSMLIRVREEHRPYWQFLVRMCGIVGGVFSVSGILQSVISFCYDCVHCLLWRHGGSDHVSSTNIPHILPHVNLPANFPTSPLLDLANQRQAQNDVLISCVASR